jgi:hypothetical protein
MSGYFYKNVNISDLVISGSTTVPTYSGFPPSTPFQFIFSGFSKPYNFSYNYLYSTRPSGGGNIAPPQPDVSNYATAYTIPYASGTGTIPTTIPNNPGYSFKHISAYCWGGGGGGGGGGGTGDTGAGYTSGGGGGSGGDGGYAAIQSYPISGTVNYQVGNSGPGGAPGAGATPGSANSGKSGDDGTPGNSSYVIVNGINIVNGPGGKGGTGGGSGNTANNGGRGAKGSNGTGSYATPYSGTTSGNTAAGYYPTQNSGDGGPGGIGGPSGDGGNRGGDRGSPGTIGYVQVYLTYQ